MPISLDGTSGINNDATNLNYTGTLTGGTGVVNLGSGQFYKDASGNVGIGTGSPVARLHSAGGVVSTGAVVAAAANASIIDFSGGVSRVWATGADNSTNGTLVFITASANASVYNERARIDSSGNLLVGTTSTASSSVGFRTVVNAGYVSTTTSGNYNICNTAGATGTETLIQFRYSDVAKGGISCNGTSVAYNTTSDYRLKENIAPMTGALEKVQQLKPVTYKWNADDSDGEGFIAHELQEVCPSAVTGEKDAVDAEGNPVYQGIDTSFLVATLTAAIQEQQAIIQSLTARIEALEGQA